MRLKRAILSPAILALGTAGSILAGSAVSVAVVQASTANVVVVAAATPNTLYHS